MGEVVRYNRRIDMFSIIIPVYNCERIIQKSISSIISQSFESWELILVDDGSKDNSGLICDKFSAQDSRIKTCHINNGGPARARNEGLELAKGQYILFVDADDFLEKDTLQKLYNIIENNKPELVIFSYYNDCIMNGTVQNNFVRRLKTGTCQSNQEFKQVYMDLDSRYMTYPVWNKVYSRQLINDCQAFFPEDVHLAEDFVFNMRVYTAVQKVIMIDEPLYHYVFQASNSITQQFRKGKLKEFKKVYRSAESQLGEWLPEALNGVKNMFLHEINIYVNNMFNKNTELTYQERKKYVKDMVCDKEIHASIKGVCANSKRHQIVKIMMKYKMVNLFLLVGRISRIGKEY